MPAREGHKLPAMVAPGCRLRPGAPVAWVACGAWGAPEGPEGVRVAAGAGAAHGGGNWAV
jgi:hypothetical protein